MTALERLPVIAGVTGGGALVAFAYALRKFAPRYFNLSARGSAWRIAIALLALLNLKNLPFVWHVRIIIKAPKIMSRPACC